MSNNFISSVWNFCEYSTKDVNYFSHDVYRWYGKLIPQLVRKVIKLYSDEGDLILANFSGSGTIPLEAILNNRNCIGIDSNPLSEIVGKVKTTKVQISKEKFKEVVNFVINKASNEFLEKVIDDNIYQWEKWYDDEETIKKLISLRDVIKNIEEPEEIKNILLVSLVSIVRGCSKVDSRCVNHIVVDKNKDTNPVFDSFENSSLDIFNSVRELSQKDLNGDCNIYLGDAAKLKRIEKKSIDLVFSHPPYLGAINYYNIFRHSTDLLGYKYKDIRKKDFSTQSLKKYMNKMNKSFKEMHRVMKDKGYGAIVIGDVRKNGNIVPLGAKFINSLEKYNFNVKDIFIWVQKNKAGMNVARRGNHIDHNYIIIVQKEDNNG